MDSTQRVTILALTGLLLAGGVASARPSESRWCGVQLELPGILRDEPVAVPSAAAPVDLTAALKRGLRLASLESPELLADLTIALPEGFALHGGSVVELNRALASGRFLGTLTTASTLAKIIPLVPDDEIEAVAKARTFTMLTSGDIAAEGGDSALIEVPKSLAKTSAVAARALGLNRSKQEKYDALAPVIDHLTSGLRIFAGLKDAAQARSVDPETRTLIAEYLKTYRDPSRWTIENANLREGLLFVFKASAARGKIAVEDPREIGTVLALTPSQGLSFEDLWAIIPLSKYDRSDLVDALPGYGPVFTSRRASSR